MMKTKIIKINLYLICIISFLLIVSCGSKAGIQDEEITEEQQVSEDAAAAEASDEDKDEDGDSVSSNTVSGEDGAGSVSGNSGSDKSREGSFQEILYKYREAEEGNYSSEDLEKMDLWTGLSGCDWPDAKVNDEVEYFYYDIDSDGKDELFITFKDRIIDIYCWDGEKARLAANTGFADNVELYPDGLLKITYSGEDDAGTEWYQYDKALGDFFAVFEDRNGEYYTFYYYDMSEEEHEETEKAYRESGYYPVYVGEWSDMITKDEYEKLLPKSEPVKLPEGEKLSDVSLPADYTEVLVKEEEPELKKTGSMDFTDDVQYEANIFLSNFVEQYPFKGYASTISADSDIKDLIYFAFRNIEMNGPEVPVEYGYIYTITVDQVRDIIDRFFGVKLTDKQAEEYKDTTTGLNNRYEDGVFYYLSAYGDIRMGVAVVREINELEDGTYEMLFDIYAPSGDDYDTGKKDFDTLYRLSADDAAKQKDIYFCTTGSAIVKPYKYNGRDTWQLIKLKVDTE